MERWSDIITTTSLVVYAIARVWDFYEKKKQRASYDEANIRQVNTDEKLSKILDRLTSIDGEKG